MKRVFYLIFLLIFAFTCVIAQKNDSITINVKEFVGEYVYSSGFVGATYKINEDGRFEYSSFSDCCDPVRRELGNYVLKDNQLHFKISKKTINDYNLLDPKQATQAYRKLYNYKGEDIKADEIETEYDMQIVKWGARVYLIRPERLHLFAAAVNFGIEPRQSVINENFLTTDFYLRRGDENKSVSGKPTLPKEFISYLQDSPTKATITKIELQDKEKIYIINKGNANGIKKGMALIGDKAIPDYDDLLWVISVDENSAKVKSLPIFRAREYQIDNVIVTKINK